MLFSRSHPYTCMPDTFCCLYFHCVAEYSLREKPARLGISEDERVSPAPGRCGRSGKAPRARWAPGWSGMVGSHTYTVVSLSLDPEVLLGMSSSLLTL